LELIHFASDPFIRHTFTEKEIRLALLRSDPLSFFATRFAGKEAVFKALNITGEDVRLSEIEILSQENGRPYVSLYGSAKETAKALGINNMHLSLSYEDHYAIAFAVAED
jgi:holo-[acyl-carrier protein] synthase